MQYQPLNFEDWSEYYSEKNYYSVDNRNSQSKIEINDAASYYILLCMFINQKNDGAIRYNSSSETTNLLIELSTFESCFSYKPGGSLYID